MASSSSSPKKDLAIKESILGVLSAKDRSGKGCVPIAEFDKVVGAFGLSWENSAVKNVLEHCKMESGDRIDFSALKNELEMEKKRLTAKPVMRANKTPVVATPRATGILKEQQIYMKEKQQKVVQEQVSTINTVYKLLSNHDINKSTAINLLTQYQIYPTKELLKVADAMEMGEVSFAEFNRSLTASEPFPKANAILQAQINSELAGGVRPPTRDRFISEEAIPGRKLFESFPSQVKFIPNEEIVIEQPKFTRKMAMDARAEKGVVGALFNETGDSWLGNPHQVDWSASPSGRRHHVQDESFNADWARAQLNHGDCISWQQYETELEARNAALERPVGRKLDDNHIMANYLTDIITWDGFKGQNGLPQDEVVRRELSMVGGLSVASGQRNATSSKNILAWEEFNPEHKSPGFKSIPVSNLGASAAVLNIGEYDRYTPPNALATTTNSTGSSSQDDLGAFAGSPSLRAERPQLRKVTSNSFRGSPTAPPFGTDDTSPNSRSPSHLYGRGRTSSGMRFGSSESRTTSTSVSPVFDTTPAGKSTRRAV